METIINISNITTVDYINKTLPFCKFVKYFRNQVW